MSVEAGHTDLSTVRGVGRFTGRLRIVSGLALTAATLAIVFLAGEIGARWVLSPAEQAALPRVGLSEESQARLRWQERAHAKDDAGAYQFDMPDPVLGWRIRPSVHVRSIKPGSYDVMVTTNPQGLRGTVPVSNEKAEGHSRIGIFGCSLTFGEGVGDDETYSAQLATDLPMAEVLNFGVHGYGTDQMLLRYEADGVANQLDVVVLAFAGFHMARNASAFTFFAKPRFELAADGGLRLTGLPVPSPAELLVAGVEEPSLPLVDASVLLRWSWGRIRNLRERSFYQPDGPGWLLTRALIARFASDTRAAGSRMILVNIDEDFPQLEDGLEALAEELSIGYLNLAPVMRTLQQAGVEYRLKNDGHWNALGHQVVARQLRDYFCTTGLPGTCHGRADG